MNKLIYIFLFFLIISCISKSNNENDSRQPIKIKTSEFREIPLSDSEEWDINGRQYQIAGTSLTGGILFTVKVLIREKPGEKHRELANLIARQSLLNGYFLRAKQTTVNGSKAEIGDKIGIAIIKYNIIFITIQSMPLSTRQSGRQI